MKMIKYWSIRNIFTDTLLRNNDGEIRIFMDMDSGKYYILILSITLDTIMKKFEI